MLASSRRRSLALPLLIALCGLSTVTVSTLYWAQSMTPLVRLDLGWSLWVSLMPSATLAGYALGVAALAAFARDMTTANGLGLHALLLGLGLAIAAIAPSAPVVALACVIIGFGCSLTQRVLACAASAVCPMQRGPVIGCVVASGLFGIVAARALVPAASAVLGWRMMFMLDAAAICCCGILAAIAAQRVDRRGWEADTAPLPSAWALWMREPMLRRAALRQGFVFATFNAGWAVFPRLLSHEGAIGAMTIGAIASFGACAALVAGMACKRRGPSEVASSGLYAVVLAGIVAIVANSAGPLAYAAMALLDIGTQTSLVANQAQAQTLATSPAMRGRVAAIVTTVGFAAGAIGAAIGNASS